MATVICWPDDLESAKDNAVSAWVGRFNRAHSSRPDRAPSKE